MLSSTTIFRQAPGAVFFVRSGREYDGAAGHELTGFGPPRDVLKLASRSTGEQQLALSSTRILRSRDASNKMPRRSSQRGASRGKLDLAELNGHVGYFLRRVQVAVFKNFIETLADFDVRPAQYSVLVVIAANPGHSQAAIGKTLNIERARLARMLHELEHRQWVERRSAANDGRSHSLFLTPAGERALTRIKRLAARHEGKIGRLLGVERRAQLLELLREFG
jgi:DNA-binding MarR family transcriptional regulator